MKQFFVAGPTVLGSGDDVQLVLKLELRCCTRVAPGRLHVHSTRNLDIAHL